MTGGQAVENEVLHGVPDEKNEKNHGAARRERKQARRAMTVEYRPYERVGS